MSFATKKYSLLSRVKDSKRFNIESLEHYSLLLQLGDNNFRLCVTDGRDDTCLLLEDFELNHPVPDSQAIDSLRQLFDDHHFLLANFWNSVIISIKNNKIALIPAENFSELYLIDYLKFAAPLNPLKEQYKYQDLNEIGAVAVFAVPANLIEFLESVYIKVPFKLAHQRCALIKALLKNQNLKPFKQIYINLEHKSLSLFVISDGSLMYCNQFQVKSANDLIRYTILVAREFDIDLKHSGIKVWSSVRDDSAFINELKRYIDPVQFGQGPAFLKFSFEFDDVPEHHYLDVYGIHLCV